MKDRETKYFWYNCRKKGCNKNFVVAVPTEIFFEAAESKQSFAFNYKCPKCKHVNIIPDIDLSNPLSEAGIKTYKIVQKHKDNIKFKLYWEGEEPK